jgi:hypothetical protein
MPFLVGACYITYGQGIEVGALTFYVIRLLLLGGLIRVIIRREFAGIRLITLDKLMILWGAVAVLSSFGHEDPGSAVVFRLGMLYDYGGTYFLFRVLNRSLDDLRHTIRLAAITLAPVALEMLLERMTGMNRFAGFGGVPEVCQVRNGKIRAQGPFMHPILAGTVGAVCIPLMAALWRRERRLSVLGLGSCVLMVITSGSSGPTMSAIFACGALWFWAKRRHMRALRWGAVGLYAFLDLVMKVPAYYLLARLDLAGGSTGWHRAELINTAIRHFGEWWLVGTDYTRHWMPTGVSWNPNHTDITNQYLTFGVVGGFPLMVLFIAILVTAFKYVGEIIRGNSELPTGDQFFVWALGASLFANAATCVSVSYFDQSFLFLYMTLGAIGAARASLGKEKKLTAVKREALQEPTGSSVHILSACSC